MFDHDDDILGEGRVIGVKRGVFWFLLHVVVVIVLVFVVNTSWLKQQTLDEARSFGVIVGEEAALGTFDRSVGWYQSTVVAWDLEQKLYDALKPKDGDSTDRIGNVNRGIGEVTGGFFEHVDRSLNNFWLLVFQMMYRISVLFYWFAFLGFVLLIAVVDGLVYRDIVKHTFGWSSVNMFRVGAWIVSWSPILLSLYLSLPIVPWVAHLMPLLFWLGLSLGMWVMAKNFTRYF